MEDFYVYERLGADGKIEHCPNHDPEGKITGVPIIGVKAWMDEHPEERKALGWIKHISPGMDNVEFNRQTQYLKAVPHFTDEFTIVDEYIVMDKSEDQLLFQEMGVAFDSFYFTRPNAIGGIII